MKKINNRFLYWCIGWCWILRHPISSPIDLGKTIELLTREKD